MKKYYITYPIVIGLPALVIFILSLAELKAGFVPSLFFSLCIASYGWVVSRIVLHLSEKDNSAKTWQLNIYAMLISAFWTVAVFAETDWIISGALAVVVGACMMFIGVRYDDENENGIPDGLEKIVSTVKKAGSAFAEQELMHTMRYKPREDKLGNAEDTERPLCLIDNKALTINEAIALGKTAEAKEAIEYLRKIIK